MPSKHYKLAVFLLAAAVAVSQPKEQEKTLADHMVYNMKTDGRKGCSRQESVVPFRRRSPVLFRRYRRGYT